MNPMEGKADWFKKGATMSDKSARKEFGLTQEEIYEGIDDGMLHYHESDVFGNPYLKLLRNEVETFVEKKYGKKHLEKRKIKNELAQINRELKRLRTQVASLERKRIELIGSLDE